MSRRILIRIAFVLSVVLVLLCGTAVAFMFRHTSPLVNVFETASVSCQVYEAVDGNPSVTSGEAATNTKSSIQVKNTGNIPAYIRVSFVSYWIDSEGNIVEKASEMPTISYNTESWFEKDGIYYCKTPIDSMAKTPELLSSSISLKMDTENGYRQVLEVFAEAIQSLPNRAVEDSWNVGVDGEGNLSATKLTRDPD
ncbi:MAG: hypothetical protein IKU72_01750 [Oscillospiraceae bacterium]|nr:hypothetical protein [Oscillospiraceae bacterium]